MYSSANIQVQRHDAAINFTS